MYLLIMKALHIVRNILYNEKTIHVLRFRRADSNDSGKYIDTSDIGNDTWAFITIVISASNNARMYTNEF